METPIETAMEHHPYLVQETSGNRVDPFMPSDIDSNVPKHTAMDEDLNIIDSIISHDSSSFSVRMQLFVFKIRN